MALNIKCLYLVMNFGFVKYDLTKNITDRCLFRISNPGHDQRASHLDLL